MPQYYETKQNIIHALYIITTSILYDVFLANHECRSDSEISTDFDELLDGTICMASRNFIKGEQFTIYYGNRSNADFLVHNGFVDSTAGTREADDEPAARPATHGMIHK